MGRQNVRRKSLRSFAASYIILVGLEEGDEVILDRVEEAGRRRFLGLAARLGVVLVDVVAEMLFLVDKADVGTPKELVCSYAGVCSS